MIYYYYVHVTTLCTCIYNVSPHRPRLKDIDRSSAKSYRITVDSVTVIITEYQHLNADPE